MKKKFLLIMILIFICLIAGGDFAFAGLGYCGEDPRQPECVLESINSLKGDNLNLEKEILILQQSLDSISTETIEYYSVQINILEKQKESYKKTLKIFGLEYRYCTALINGESYNNCSTSGVDLYDLKINLIQENIDKLKGLLDLKNEGENKKIEAEKELLLQQDREEKAKDYLVKADFELQRNNVSRAISLYKYSCNNYETYECYYSLGNVYFLQAQEFYKKTSYYGCDRLYKEQLNKALESLTTASKLSDTNDEKEVINRLKNQIENYPETVQTVNDKNKGIVEAEKSPDKIKEISKKEQYKTSFSQKLGIKLSKFPLKSLEKLQTQITTYLSKSDLKEDLRAKLEALLELIEAEIEIR